jgi:hypothetical protein
LPIDATRAFFCLNHRPGSAFPIHRSLQRPRSLSDINKQELIPPTLSILCDRSPRQAFRRKKRNHPLQDNQDLPAWSTCPRGLDGCFQLRGKRRCRTSRQCQATLDSPPSGNGYNPAHLLVAQSVCEAI